jgi:spoIIIJ-associated protein
MREVERSAASVEEALEAALQELGISEQEAEVEIVQEARGGLLGLGSKGAVVRVRARGQAASSEQADFAEEFVRGLVDRMELDADVEQNEVEGVTYVDIVGRGQSDEMGILIGRHGQTLESMQDILRGAMQRKMGERCLIVIDVEDYRKRRRSQLVERTHDAGERVRKTGKPERMEPMSPYERKIVHDTVASIGGLESASEGEEPQRRVVVSKRGRGST